MATLLNEKKSTGGDPYAYYTVNATASDRTANDVKVVVEVISRLSSSQAFLGTGSTYGRDGYITLQGKEYKIPLKATNERWSGTTKHKAYSGELTIEIEGSKSQIENIKFRVSPTGSASGNYNQAAALKSTSCSNLYIGIGHEKPSNVSFTITEKNQKLIDAGISNETFVNNLSIKEYNISATLHDGASVSNYNIVNRVYIESSKVTPFQIDYSISDILLWQETGKVPIRAIVDDNMNASGSSSSAANPSLYNYIPYTKIGLIETSTTARRNGQTSGKVYLNINGTFYNGSVGNVTQTKPTIKYKFWKLGDNEPTTYNNTIPSDNISILNNTFSVSNFEIGSSVETATNYFNPELAYRIKIYVEDNFTSYTSQDKPIPVGEATWTEYKDRVDFKKITIKGKDISENQILWQGAWYMNGSQTAYLSQKISEQQHGIVLVWQAYGDGSAKNWHYNYNFIPKWHALYKSSAGVSLWLTNDVGSQVASKYIYVYDDKLEGHNNNESGETERGSGIYVTNNHWVLTCVLGV